MHGRLVIAFIVSLTLTACATSQDPREGGFIGGLQGILGGAYDARIQKSQGELSNQQSLNQGLKEKSKSLDMEVQARDLLLASEQDRLAKMEGDISKLESDISLLTAKSDQQKVKIAALKRRIEDQRTRLKSLQSSIRNLDQAGGSASNPGHYQVLKQERDRLDVEYRRLLEYYQTLSKATN